MAFCTTEYGELDWKQLEPGEQIRIETDKYVYEFEMDETRENLVLISNLRDLPTDIREHARYIRNKQEIIYNQDIDIDNMIVILRSEANTIGLTGSYCLLYIRLVITAPCGLADKNAEPLLLSSELIRKIEPIPESMIF